MTRISCDWGEFQSTLPARGATLRSAGAHPALDLFQSTLPARGATCFTASSFAHAGISIHAPRTGSDSGSYQCLKPMSIFQSTLPARGATPRTCTTFCLPCISIHAPRTGSDVHRLRYGSNRYKISIHAPRTGSDPTRSARTRATCYFNPRSPHGERPGAG